jgi:hypothetical protein
VKISDDDDSPPIDSMMLPVSMCPDPCLSTTTRKNVKKDVLVVVGQDDDDDNVTMKTKQQLDKEPVIPFLLKDEETDFDAFLLDAVQWL